MRCKAPKEVSVTDDMITTGAHGRRIARAQCPDCAANMCVTPKKSDDE